MTTASAPPDTKAPSVANRTAELTRALITDWQRGYLADRPQAVAALARLRRGAGREAGELPDLWSLIDLGPLHDPQDGVRRLGELELERAENAVHAALTLWAFHQQSRGDGMHRRHSDERPTGLGAAVRRLMPTDGVDEPVRKRLVRAGTAPDLVTLTRRLRDLVSLLRRDNIPLDYGLLAAQLYTWQWPDGPTAVRGAWGRSFHTVPRKPRKPADETTANNPDTDKDAS
ncbi:type I-E CRISPR-associated protein Cse2/CasB [Streptomyces sp. enrichment culture]|uniref:type I-E CRISPR-associated protein Cse2/CasB n=1 Tax=Streptomyces sp. enrichment culture TaxID=1795815 RepID=UPI003F55D30D